MHTCPLPAQTIWPSGVQTVSRKYRKLTPHNSCGDYFLSKQNSQDTYKTVHGAPVHSHASEKNCKLYTKLKIANCHICHVFSDPVCTLGCSGAAACQTGVGLEEVTQFHKLKPSLTPSPSSIHTCIFASPFNTPHTTSISLCNDTK